MYPFVHEVLIIIQMTRPITRVIKKSKCETLCFQATLGLYIFFLIFINIYFLVFILLIYIVCKNIKYKIVCIPDKKNREKNKYNLYVYKCMCVEY